MNSIQLSLPQKFKKVFSVTGYLYIFNVCRYDD